MLRNWISFVLFILVVVFRSSVQLNYVPIGALFDNDTSYDESFRMLEYAVAEANEKILRRSDLQLSIEAQPIEYGREFTVSKRVCNLLQLQVGVVLGPRLVSSAQHAINICDAKEIPYINIYLDEDAASKSTVLNIHPNLDSQTQLLLDYVNISEWKEAAILYESPLRLRNVAGILEAQNHGGSKIRVFGIDYTSNNNNFWVSLKRVRDSEIKNIILDCSSESLASILKQSMQVGLMTKYHMWIIMNLDAHSIDFEPYQYSGVNITIFRILNPDHPIFDLRPQAQSPDDSKIAPYFYTAKGKNSIDGDDNKVSILPYPKKLNKVVSLQTSLIYDSVMVFANAIQQLGADQVTTMAINCDERSSSWNKGYTIMNFMKSIKYDGLTRQIEFDNAGLRSNLTVDILELTEYGLKAIGTWMFGMDSAAKRLNISRTEDFSPKSEFDENSLRNKSLTVITALAKPYTMLKEEAASLTGNDRYEGYAIDLIKELSLMLGFSYTFIEQVDGHYGIPDERTGKWDGMIGEVLNGRADIAITDLTVTSDRLKVLDFSPSILNLGIAILFRTPRGRQPSTFSFMAPFSNGLWISVGLTYLFVSFCFFGLSRIAPSQWENPYPCVEEPKYLENQFSFRNSMWFTVGALLQEGTEIEVKAPSLRLVAAVWWFFTLIIVNSYTANLAAFLVIENKLETLKGVEDFANCGLPDQPPCKAKFGAKLEGSTLKYFQDSKDPIFSNMYKVMTMYPERMVKENEDGLRRAMAGDYAYLMESTTLQYYTERYCDVRQVGGFIDERFYAIGMRKGYEHYHIISEGILKLQERGTFTKLHTKWWKAKRGGGACQKVEIEDHKSLELDHLEGIFYVLAYGIGLAFLYAVFDTIWVIRNRAKQFRVSFRQEMKIELKFLLKSLMKPDNPKPVRKWRRNSIAQSHDNTNSEGLNGSK